MVLLNIGRQIEKRLHGLRMTSNNNIYLFEVQNALIKIQSEIYHFVFTKR